jgi:hypothetical protein
VLTVAGCGNDTTSAPTARPLTDEQASRLANVLFDNLDSKGATFEVNARTADGMTINLTGEVDWAGHYGHGTVSATGAEADLVEVFWSEDEVLERRPDLNRQLLDQENRAVVFVARPAAPAGRAIDRLLGIVTALAGPQRDNPLLIKQKSGSAFLRTDELRGIKVDVMRFGDHNVYWLDQQTGLLTRFEDTGATGGQPVVVDVLSRGPQQIAGPPAELVVRVADIAPTYPFPQS